MDSLHRWHMIKVKVVVMSSMMSIKALNWMEINGVTSTMWEKKHKNQKLASIKS